MARFYADIREIAVNPVSFHLTEKYLFESVLENNPKATAWRDNVRERIVVECENKPRELVVFGVQWQEDKDG